MFNSRLLRTLASRARQRGMATTMIMLLTGTALTATTMGMMYGIRSTQEQQMASHAAVPAEAQAWEGVELVRQYLQAAPQANVTVGALQVTGAPFTARIVAKETVDSKTMVTVNITSTSSLATSTLQAVYTLGGAAATGTTLGNALTFNGDLTYTGGKLSIVNGPNLAYININGVLRISSGAKASVSGCAKNGIELSGGGVADNAILRTEGKFSLKNSEEPRNLTLSAKTIDISQNGGSYLSIKAGAFSANVIAGGSTIGTALVGGTINTDVNQTITPLGEGISLITLTDGTVYTLDLSLISQSNHVITTTATGAAKRISGSGSLPATLSMTYRAVYGGEVTFANSTVSTFWANNINFTGWQGNYSLLKTHGNVSLNTATIGLFQGGGNMTFTSSDKPSFSSPSRLTGSLRNGDGSDYTASLRNLTPNTPNSSPGLPGVPYCDLTLKPVDVSTLRDQANYVFYFDGNTPMLRIQNVNRANGTAVDPGPYNLATTDLQRISGADFLICEWYYNSGGNNTCGKSASPGSGWVFNGVMSFPTGVAWFQGNMSFDGVQMTRLTNTLLSTGNVTLTRSSNAPLYAPNFAGASQTCGGSFYPTNLCKSTSALATWNDANGATRTGLPLGNIAIEAERALETNGWTIWGNVILGGLVNTGAATTNIKGGLSTGNNGVSATTISQGGIAVDVSSMSADQAITGTTTTSPGGTGTGSSGGSTAVKWVRSL